jgi:hypothetical protein
MDSHIYVSEDKMWAAKGCFSQAILEDDPIAWDVSREGEYTRVPRCLCVNENDMPSTTYCERGSYLTSARNLSSS